MREFVEWFLANPWASVLGAIASAVLLRISVGMGHEGWGKKP